MRKPTTVRINLGMGVLATAVRCEEPADRARYLKSIKEFAKLVMDNYVGSERGITNGLWPEYNEQWWCSTAIFGSLTFLLHKETGEEKYLRVATGALNWMVRQDFRGGKPVTFQQRPSGVVFYCFELYATSLGQLRPGCPQYDAAMGQIDLALARMAKNQKSRGANVSDYLQHNTDMAGLPYLMCFFARHLPQHQEVAVAADQEIRYIGNLLLSRGEPNVSRLLVWEVMTWGMLSYVSFWQACMKCLEGRGVVGCQDTIQCRRAVGYYK